MKFWEVMKLREENPCSEFEGKYIDGVCKIGEDNLTYCKNGNSYELHTFPLSFLFNMEWKHIELEIEKCPYCGNKCKWFDGLHEYIGCNTCIYRSRDSFKTPKQEIIETHNKISKFIHGGEK